MPDFESRSTRPRRQPGWSDLNRSDPGVTLLELLDYAGDLVFRAGRRGARPAWLLLAFAIGIWWWRRRHDD